VLLQSGSEVEIRCHETCPWAPGWQVADVVRMDGLVFYRVRRLGLDRPLTTLLPDRDVRRSTAVLDRVS
jgi:hypothetical protein